MTTASDDMADKHPEKRTKLDEIVERYFGSDYTGYARDVAKESFRHGVDESFEFINNRQGAATKVQPAPAEEKCPCKNCWCNRFNWRAQLHPNDVPRLLHGDSRKGERRKHEEIIFATTRSRSAWWSLSRDTESGISVTSGVDLRTGTDRRKKP